MAYLDLDTEALTAAAARLRAAGAVLADARTAVGPDDARAAGDAALTGAVGELFAAWAPAHEALTTTLEALATALDRAAAVFEETEGLTAEGFAGMLVPAPSAGRDPRTDRAV
jgi:uncharacterized protein YukE